MKPALLFTALALALPAAATAQPVSEVSVAIGDQLRRDADEKHYGQRDVDRLADDLKARTERALARQGRLDPNGGRLELQLTDARPSKPTFEELGRRPGLSMQSVYLGGAEIEGRYVAPDGAETPVRYRWYENNLRDNLAVAPWQDAESAIDRFADKVGRGELPNKR